MNYVLQITCQNFDEVLEFYIEVEGPDEIRKLGDRFTNRFLKELVIAEAASQGRKLEGLKDVKVDTIASSIPLHLPNGQHMAVFTTNLNPDDVKSLNGTTNEGEEPNVGADKAEG